MRRRDEGPQFVGSERTPQPEAAPPAPKSLREKWKSLQDNALTILSGLPRALGLVWSAHKGFTVVLAVIAVVSGSIPSATAWITKLLIDAVVAAVNSTGR